MRSREDFIKNSANTRSSNIGYDEGLRAYMIKIYNYMGAALLLTGIVAMFFASSERMLSLILDLRNGGLTGLGMLVTFSPLAFAFILGFGFHKLSLGAMHLLFWSYSFCIGASSSVIFLIYTGDSIARVFFITASVFAAMSIYGYTTKRDLTGLGSLLFMGLVGVLISYIVNSFLHSPALDFVASVIGLGIFVALVAYRTQAIKSEYNHLSSVADDVSINKIALLSSLQLYISFINIMMYLLRFFGNRRD